MKEQALKIIQTLTESGHIAVFAGGCVRDQLLGKSPKDLDIATSARPEQVEALFPKTLAIGKAFGVIVVLLDGYQFEVTTFRGEHNYSDGRRPDSVEFTQSPEEDCQRRDFTINGLFLDASGNVLDFVNGQEDLQKKVIRAIGNPDQRFQEDYLRMLRAARFSAQLGFEIEVETFYAIRRNAHRIAQISAERVRDELSKILISNDSLRGLRVLVSTGLMDVVLPEYRSLIGLEQGRYHSEDVEKHTISVLLKTKFDLVQRLAALLHDIGKPQTRQSHETNEFSFYDHDEVGAGIAESVLRRLKYPNEVVERVVRIVRHHMGLRSGRTAEMSDRTLRRFARKCGEFLPEVLDVMEADFVSHPGNDAQDFAKIRQRYQQLEKEGERPSDKQRVVSGTDVMVFFQIKEGPEVGKVLLQVQEMLDEDPSLTKEQLLDRLRR